MRKRRFNLLPMHAKGENDKGMSKIDHLNEAATEKSSTGHIGRFQKNYQKMPLRVSKYGSYYARKYEYLLIKSICCE